MQPKVKIIFVHHSVGRHLLKWGNIRQLLANLAPGFQLFDHDYNSIGLSDEKGSPLSLNYNILDDNTNPEGYANLFSQDLTNPPTNSISHLLEYDIIIFKSCYTASTISSDEQLEQSKQYYRKVRQIIKNTPDKFFLIITQPPRVMAETNPAEAKRANLLSKWLLSSDFIEDSKNLAVFDLFGLLADNDPNSPQFGTLRGIYQRQGLKYWRPHKGLNLWGAVTDSHPNHEAAKMVGPRLAKFIKEAIYQYKNLPITV